MRVEPVLGCVEWGVWPEKSATEKEWGVERIFQDGDRSVGYGFFVAGFFSRRRNTPVSEAVSATFGIEFGFYFGAIIIAVESLPLSLSFILASEVVEFSVSNGLISTINDRL